MSKWYAALLLGTFIGALGGFSLCALVATGERADRPSEYIWRIRAWVLGGRVDRRIKERRKGDRRGNENLRCE